MKYSKVICTSLLLVLASPGHADGHDDDHSGQDRQEEFRHDKKKMHRRHREERKAMHQARKMEKIDTNEDGKLDLNEYLANAEERFRSMDIDQDGYVTSDEASEWRKSMREKHKEMRKSHRKKGSDSNSKG